jgi:exportin-5
VKQRVIKLLVDMSSRALDKNPSFALKVLEHILVTRLPDQPEYPVYSEAVKELHGLSSYELRRLAMRYADYFAVSPVQHTARFHSLTPFVGLL